MPQQTSSNRTSCARIATIPPSMTCNELSRVARFGRGLGLCYGACSLNRRGSLTLSLKRWHRFSTSPGTDCAATWLPAVPAAIESGRRTNSPVKSRLAATWQASKKPKTHSESGTITPAHSVDMAFVLIDSTLPRHVSRSRFLPGAHLRNVGIPNLYSRRQILLLTD